MSVQADFGLIGLHQELTGRMATFHLVFDFPRAGGKIRSGGYAPESSGIQFVEIQGQGLAVEIQFSAKWSCDLFQFCPGGQFERIGDPFAIEVVDQLRWNLPGFCQAGESFVGLDNVGLRSEVMFTGINYLACERIEPLVKRGLIKHFQFRIVELAGEFPQGLTHLPGSNQLPGGLQRIFQAREWCGSASQAYGTG